MITTNVNDGHIFVLTKPRQRRVSLIRFIDYDFVTAMSEPVGCDGTPAHLQHRPTVVRCRPT